MRMSDSTDTAAGDGGAAASARALLRWYADMGVDEAIGAEPSDQYGWTVERAAPEPVPAAPARANTRTHAPKPAAPSVTVAPLRTPPADEAAAEARRLAAACATLDELAAAVAAFDGCPLKAGARTTVFADGIPGADLLIIGEAPGKEEDQAGKPFVGRAGRLLDKMLKAIGRSRTENVFITNVLYWRPPGNRKPNAGEIAVCLPFVERCIELSKPRAVMLAGNVPTQAILQLDAGIMRTHGTWRDYHAPDGARYAALPVFHPAFLLRQPSQKKTTWRDLMALDARLSSASG